MGGLIRTTTKPLLLCGGRLEAEDFHGFSWVMTRPAGRVKRHHTSKTRESSRIQSGRARRCWKSHGSSGLGPPSPHPTREKGPDPSKPPETFSGCRGVKPTEQPLLAESQLCFTKLLFIRSIPISLRTTYVMGLFVGVACACRACRAYNFNLKILGKGTVGGLAIGGIPVVFY